MCCRNGRREVNHPMTDRQTTEPGLVRRLLQRLPRFEAVPVLLMLVVACGLWAFVGLAEEVMEGETHGFDSRIILAMRHAGDPAQPIGPYWLPAFARDVTSFGSSFGLIFIAAAVIGWLLMSRKPHAALLLTAALAGATALANIMKYAFGRPRPELVAHQAQVFTSSFPSSHALVSTTVYLTLGVIAMRYAPTRRLKIYVMSVAILLAVLIGLSRVYLGVHWPTDVLAGWALGAVFASLIWLVALWLQRRGAVERGDDPH
jgi:undecaprenyl-diphosphatase